MPEKVGSVYTVCKFNTFVLKIYWTSLGIEIPYNWWANGNGVLSSRSFKAMQKSHEILCQAIGAEKKAERGFPPEKNSMNNTKEVILQNVLHEGYSCVRLFQRSLEWMLKVWKHHYSLVVIYWLLCNTKILKLKKV